MFEWYERHRIVLDWTFAVAYAALATVAEHNSWWHIAAGIIAGVSLGIRRNRLGLSLTLAWINAGCQLASNDAPLFFATLAILQVLYSVARHSTGKVRLAGWISLPFGLAIGTAGIVFSSRWSADAATSDTVLRQLVIGAIFTGMSLALAWTSGLLVRMRTQYVQSQLTAKYASQAAAVARERGVLARDMHDVLAHSLSVMVSLSDGTRMGVAQLPAQAQQALREISSVGRSALTDVRGLLTRLRAEGDYQAAITTLDELYAQMRSAGLVLKISEDGVPYPITTPAYATVCNIMRESLTNALRHGDTASPVHINLNWHTTQVELSVINACTGGSKPADTARHWGLTGMKERASLAGGSLLASAQNGQFVVTATLPAAVGDGSAGTDSAGTDSAGEGRASKENRT